MKIGSTVTSPHARIEVAVLVNGHAQLLYRRPFDAKVFVAARPGDAFQLQVRNLAGHRVEVINTVDGRNSLKNEPGNLTTNRGMIFPGLKTACFSGWRLNDNETRQFVFGTPAGSVAEQATGETSNTGVIGFAVYREQNWTLGDASSYAEWPTGSATLSPVAVAAASSLSIGDAVQCNNVSQGLATHMGERLEDKVSRTHFVRSGPPDILVIGYDTAEALRDLVGPPEPNPFPGSETGYELFQ